MVLLLPILVPLIGGALLFRTKSEQQRDRLALALTAAGAVLTAVVCLLPEQSLTLLTIEGSLRLALRSDGLSRLFMVLTAVIWLPVLVYAFSYLRHAGREGHFLGFYVMTQGVLMGLFMADNFVTLYMFFEAMSLITMPLVLHNATGSARRAGFKYLGFSVFGAGMALAGYFIAVPYMNGFGFVPGGVVSHAAAAGHETLLLMMYVLMVLGFGAKAGMMPMQAWLPAAHPVAPAPASAVLSGVITKGGVAAVIRVTYYLFGTDLLVGSWTQKLLLTAALCTVFAGSMLAFREKQLKKRLAYSTVSQASYVLFGLLLFTQGGIVGALLQVVFHALAKDTLFLAAGAIIYMTNLHGVGQLRGIGRKMPVTMGCFALATLSLIGIPPMGGFVSKWYLVNAGLSGPLRGFGIAGLVVLVLSALLTAGYLLPIVTGGFFPGRDVLVERKEAGSRMLWPMALFAALSLVLGLFPGGLLRWLGQLAAIMCP